MAEAAIPTLPPQGRYLARVESLTAPQPMKSKTGNFAVKMHVAYTDSEQLVRSGIIYFAGYLPITYAMYESREFWVGRQIHIRVTHREHDGKMWAGLDYIRLELG